MKKQLQLILSTLFTALASLTGYGKNVNTNAPPALNSDAFQYQGEYHFYLKTYKIIMN